MSKHKQRKYSKHQQKHGFFRHLYGWFSSSFQIVLLLLVPIAMLAVASQMYETQRPNSEPSSLATPIADDDTIQTVQSATQVEDKDILIANPEPSPSLAANTEVLVYTGEGNEGWQAVSFGQVEKGQEFQLEDELYSIDLNGGELIKRKIPVSKLTEADRMFEPDNWRFPEEDDVVRFVDEAFNHIRHDWMGTARPGNRFLFQGQLYESLAHPDDPNRYGYRKTEYVLVPPSEMAVVDAVVELTLRSEDDREFFVVGLPQDPYFIASSNASVPMGELKVGMTFQPDEGPLVTVVSSRTRRGQFVVHEPTYLTPINPPSQEELIAKVSPATEIENDRDTGSDFVDELFAEQNGKVHPFDLASQAAQAQAVNVSNVHPTDFGFTGQRHENFGLIDYGGRYYNPATGQFVSADLIIPNPGNPQAFNRYGYAYNNPIRFNDPTGHCIPGECLWTLSQEMYDRHGGSPAGTLERYRNGANVLAAMKDYDPTMSSLNMSPSEFASPKMGILYEMNQYQFKEGLEAQDPYVFSEVAQAAAEAGIFFFGRSSSDDYMPPKGYRSESGTTKLYRAVSKQEYEQIMQTGTFETVGQSVEGKYFAENLKHAGKWGDAFYGKGGYRVIEVELPTSTADQFYRWDNLDNIGPARFAEIEQLRNADITIRGVR